MIPSIRILGQRIISFYGSMGGLKAGVRNSLSALSRIPLVQLISTAIPQSVRARFISPVRRCLISLILTRRTRRPSGRGEEILLAGDLSGAEFVVFVGSSPFEANYGPPYRSNKITEGLVSGRLKYAVVDPRLSKTASKAWKWLPIKPGYEGALALAMTRWIIENKRYDAKYLANANKASSKADNEPTWSNACWLVKMKDGKPGEFLRASDLGIEKSKKTKALKDGTEVEYEFDQFACYSAGQAGTFDPNDPDNPAEGDLFVDTEVNGIKVKSALEIIRLEADKYSIEEWSALCGLEAKDIIALAKEFTSHGKRACADIHRGVSQHTNGFYNVLAWYTLNLLIGNYDWQGGLSQASTYDNVGEKEGKPYDMGSFTPRKSLLSGLASSATMSSMKKPPSLAAIRPSAPGFRWPRIFIRRYSLRPRMAIPIR